MIKKFSAIALLALSPLLSWGETAFSPLEALVKDSAILSDLQTNGENIVFHDGLITPETLPETVLNNNIKKDMIEGNLTLGMEGLYLVTDLPDSYWNVEDGQRTLTLYNILRSVSTLEGLEYYSQTSKKMKELFQESWAMEEGNEKKKLPDPLVTSVPSHDLIYIHQKDNRFSKNQYTMEYYSNGPNLAASIVNLSNLRVAGMFKVVDSGDMQIHLSVMPVQEGILIYVTMAAATDTSSFREKAQQSFGNRAIALKEWFKTRLDEEFN